MLKNEVLERVKERLRRINSGNSVTVVLVDHPMPWKDVFKEFGKGMSSSFDFWVEANDEFGRLVRPVELKSYGDVNSALERHWRKAGEHLKSAMDGVNQEIDVAARDSRE